MMAVSWSRARFCTNILGERSCACAISRVFKEFTSIPALYCKGNEDFNSSIERDLRRKDEKIHKNYLKEKKLKRIEYLTKKEEIERENNLKKVIPGGKKSVEKKNTMKNFRIMGLISDHDLQIKINSMLEYLEKGKRVVCSINAKYDKAECSNILTKLNNSKLKSYYINSSGTDTLVIAHYGEKKVKEPSEKYKEKATDKST